MDIRKSILELREDMATMKTCIRGANKHLNELEREQEDDEKRSSDIAQTTLGLETQFQRLDESVNKMLTNITMQ